MLVTIITDHNPLIKIYFAEDHQIDEIHKIVHKTDIVDQIVDHVVDQKISMEMITQDQTQKKIFTQILLGIVHIHTPGTDTVPGIVQEIHQAIIIKIV